MGLFDNVGKLARKARDAAGQRPDQVRKALDQAEDQINKRTGGNHSSQVDAATDKVADSCTSRPMPGVRPAPQARPGLTARTRPAAVGWLAGQGVAVSGGDSTIAPARRLDR